LDEQRQSLVLFRQIVLLVQHRRVPSWKALHHSGKLHTVATLSVPRSPKRPVTALHPWAEKHFPGSLVLRRSQTVATSSGVSSSANHCQLNILLGAIQGAGIYSSPRTAFQKSIVQDDNQHRRKLGRSQGHRT
jgi:hypothetical protein